MHVSVLPAHAGSAPAGQALAGTPALRLTRKGHLIMGDDRSKGTAKQVKGSVKDAAGKTTGDKKLQAEGNMDKAVGGAQKEVGKAKDDARKK